MTGVTTRAQDGTVVPCAVCGATDTRPRHTKHGYQVARCRRCGLVYANPRAPEDKILGRYTKEYFWTEYLPSLGVTDGTFDLRRFDDRYGPVLTLMAERTQGRRFLEVGSGAGFFLKTAERRGWQTTGIELSEEGVQFARTRLGVEVRQQRAEEMATAGPAFDAAGMFDVIEHLFDPRSVLCAINRMLVPGGLMVITTPNYDSLNRYLLGVDWAVISPTEHVYYFTETTLRNLLEACGFRSVEFVRGDFVWGPHETLNARYTHAPDSRRARWTRDLVDEGGVQLASVIQWLGRQDSMLCFARKR